MSKDTKENIKVGITIFISAVAIITLFYLGTVYLTAIESNGKRADHCEYVDGLVYSKDTKPTGNVYLNDAWSAGTSGKCVEKGQLNHEG